MGKRIIYLLLWFMAGIGCTSFVAHATTNIDPYTGLPVVVAKKYNSLTCPAPNDPPEIVVKLELQKPLIDHTRTQDELEKFNTSELSPYGAHAYTRVQGLMRGTIKVDSSVTLGWRTNTSNDQNCYWYQRVDLVLRQAPIIYVANDITKNTCDYFAIIEHEKKHVAVDEQLLQTYADKYKQALQKLVDDLGVRGPYPNAVHDEVQSTLKQSVSDTIKSIHKQMRTERMQRQNAIDTLEEYERVSNACVGEQMRVR